MRRGRGDCPTPDLTRGLPAGAALADGVGAVVHAARMRALAGHAFAAAGDRDAALPVLRRAEADLAAAGAERLRAEVVCDLRKLVALGRTNREIAAELFVSEKTVEGHLRNVFTKLDVSARAAVAEIVGRSRAD